MRADWLAAVLGFLMLSLSSAGSAQPAPPGNAAPAPSATPPRLAQQDERQARPENEKPVRSDQARNYETEPGTEPEDVALFLPRVVLAVPRYALKLAFFPIREGIRFVDEHAIAEKVTDILYNDARTAAIVPTLSIDSYFGPTFGLKAFHEDLAGHEEYASAEAKFGGVYQLASQLHFRAAHVGGSDLWLESVARFESEPALLFQGIGTLDASSSGTDLDPRAAAVASRFSEQRLLALLRGGLTFGRPGEMLQLGSTGVYNVRSFGAKRRGNDPSIEQVYDTAALVGFAERVATLELDLNLIVDLRDVAGATGSGIYLEAFAGRVPRLAGYEFWHHGAELTGYIDLYRRSRVLVLRAVVEGVDGGPSDIPFSALPRLGGPHRLRGFPLDRFRDEKALVGTVEYHYPIHQYVAGALFVDAGRVEQAYTDLFDGNWQIGGGGGFIFRSRDRQLFAFEVAYGEGVQFHLTTDPLRAFSKKDTEL